MKLNNYFRTELPMHALTAGSASHGNFGIWKYLTDINDHNFGKIHNMKTNLGSNESSMNAPLLYNFKIIEIPIIFSQL